MKCDPGDGSVDHYGRPGTSKCVERYTGVLLAVRFRRGVCSRCSSRGAVLRIISRREREGLPHGNHFRAHATGPTATGPTTIGPTTIGPYAIGPAGG
jgi:hypothetical protein